MADWVSGRTDIRPYFFLSYRHSEYQPLDGTDQDFWIKKFHQDLCKDVNHLTSAVEPGYMDAGVRTGADWRDKLAKALGGCRVFVPVLSAGYCDSAWCGKEWGAFAERMRLHTVEGEVQQAIVPVSWGPRMPPDLPAFVRNLQLRAENLPDEYYQFGLYGMMKLERFRAAYELSVLLLARLIGEVGEEADLPVSPPIDLDDARNAFADHQARDAPFPIRVKVASYRIAPVTRDQDTATAGPPARSDYYYGHQMRDWMPYRASEEDTTTIVSCAETVIADLGLHTVLDPLDDEADDAEPAPSVMLVDPWVANVPDTAAKLRRIDQRAVHVVLPWNSQDRELGSHRDSLRTGLREMLRNSLQLKGSATGVPTHEAFHAQLPKAVYEAISRHQGTAPAYPPARPSSMGRPSLGGMEV